MIRIPKMPVPLESVEPPENCSHISEHAEVCKSKHPVISADPSSFKDADVEPHRHRCGRSEGEDSIDDVYLRSTCLRIDEIRLGPIGDLLWMSETHGDGTGFDAMCTNSQVQVKRRNLLIYGGMATQVIQRRQ